MRLSRTFCPTLHQAPAEASDASHQLLLRSGMVRPLGAGSFAYLPLGQAVRRRVQEQARRSLSRAGGQEIAIPPVAADALWAEAGLTPAGEPLRDMPWRLPLSMEAAVTTLVRHDMRSHRSLPALLYGFRPRFSGAPPPGLGPLSARQTLLLEVYGLYPDPAGAQQGWRDLESSLRELLQQCGLGSGLLLAGSMEAEPAGDLWLPSVPGDEPFVRCPQCGYTAGLHRACRSKEADPPAEPLPREEVLTPACHTIAGLAAFLGIPESRTSKAVFLSTGDRLVFAVVRGDMEVDEVKLAGLLGVSGFRPAREDEIAALGAAPGFASPIGIRRDGPVPVVVVVDDLVPRSANLVAGANRPDVHLVHVNYGRDYTGDLVADIVAVREGDPCPRCRAPLELLSTTVLARLWAPGGRLSALLGATFQDAAGSEQPLLLVCAEVDLDRLVAACVEVHHDEAGILWPAGLAPWAVHLLTIGNAPEVAAAADHLERALEEGGFPVLYDDRDGSAGSKFVEADLLGMPLRVALSKRTVAQEAAEVKRRDRPRESLQAIPIGQVPSWVRDELRALAAEGVG